MMNGIKYAALASAFVLAGGSAVWAQTYNPNTGIQGNNNPGVQSSLGQSSLGQSSPGLGVTADTQQRIRQSLEQSGFRNVEVVPQSYVVRAQAPDGSRIVMFMSPDQFAEVAFPGGNQGLSGTGSQAFGGQSNRRSGYGNGPSSTEQQAQQELTRYGYSDLRDLRPMQGWTADATKNGENVHVMLSENGMVATFQGR
jgi:hypothetical protein